MGSPEADKMEGVELPVVSCAALVIKTQFAILKRLRNSYIKDGELEIELEHGNRRPLRPSPSLRMVPVGAPLA